jgi:hypothetical protein
MNTYKKNNLFLNQDIYPRQLYLFLEKKYVYRVTLAHSLFQELIN